MHGLSLFQAKLKRLHITATEAYPFGMERVLQLTHDEHAFILAVAQIDIILLSDVLVVELRVNATQI